MATAPLGPRTVAANPVTRLPSLTQSTIFPQDGSPRLAAFLSNATMLGVKEIGIAVDALIAKLDALGGDPDLEDGGDDEEAGDHLDTGYSEWHTRDPRNLRRMVGELPADTGHYRWSEDDEDDSEDACQAGDDGCAPFMTYYGPRWGSHEYEVDREPELVGDFGNDVGGGKFAANDA